VTTIQLSGMRKSYDSHEIIKGIDLSIKSGEFVVLVGPSGCGKSTLLRMIAGLEGITSGELLIDGVRANDIHPAQRGAAMVFQNYALYPHMTVARNLGFALEVSGKSKDDIKQAVGRAAEILNISHLLDALPKALSGGERQRVAIGRAIVRKPKFFLFDEPLSNLDASLRGQMRIELLRLHQELNTTMIYVTHDQIEAMTMGDRVALLRKGLLEQVGNPLTLYRQPRNIFVAGFLGAPAINLLDAECQNDNTLLLQGGHKLALLAGTPTAIKNVAKIGIRPEDFSLHGTEGIQGNIVVSEHLGDHVIVHVQLPGVPTLVTAKVSSGTELIQNGQSVSLVPSQKNILYFDSAGNNLALSAAA
jgi:multiple sugar transport system ATP-binding protein